MVPKPFGYLDLVQRQIFYTYSRREQAQQYNKTIDKWGRVMRQPRKMIWTPTGKA
jgi:hypothetical protein